MKKNSSRDLKSLRSHNSTGAKEVSIQMMADGSMVGAKRKEYDAPASPTTNLQSKKKPPANVTPIKKMMPRVPRDKSKTTWDVSDIILTTESVGPDGSFIILIGLKDDDTDVFMKPLLDSIKNPKPGSKLCNPQVFDCRLYNPKNIFLRKSHEENKKIQLKVKNYLSQTAIIAYPNKNEFEEELENNNLFLEELLKDQCGHILQEHERKGIYSKFVPMIEWKSLTKESGYRPLDHVLLDSTVASVLCNYFVNEDDSEGCCDIYKKLKELDIQDYFFSRHADTNKYSELAINKFGYPGE